MKNTAVSRDSIYGTRGLDKSSPYKEKREYSFWRLADSGKRIYILVKIWWKSVVNCLFQVKKT